MIELTDMQIANRVKWVRALLSGDYEQGRTTLKIEEDGVFSYCCLGVACEIVAPKARELKLKVTTGTADGYMSDTRAEYRFGMNAADQHRSGSWNDSEQLTFARIADLVAWATEHRARFTVILNSDVPNGYAIEWLKQFDD